ncbi:MAG: glycosyltransferase, partial [Candidatus Acidiferrales bacterium]
MTVIVPTYRRHEALTACVRSILIGKSQPDEIIVVGRRGDGETERSISRLRESSMGCIQLRSVWVTIPGHIPPIEAGLSAASGGLVAIVDDDVTVRADWLGQLISNFSDSSVGVVGGRTIIPGMPLPKLKGQPGQIAWYGKAWGNIASLDGSGPIKVDSVMEGNWAWRRDLLSSIFFDPVLNFDDAAMYGVDLCLQAQRKGYRVIYE